MEKTINFFYIKIEDSAISLKNSYLELDLNVIHWARGHAWYSDGYDIRLVSLDPIALFENYRLTSSSGKEIY